MSRRSGAQTALVVDGGSGGSRSALATVRALAVGGDRALVAVEAGRTELAASSRWAEKLTIPSDGYAEALRSLASEVPVVFGTSDFALEILGSTASELTNKTTLSARAAVCGIATPEEWSFDGLRSLREHSGSLPFPIVVKPRERSIAAFRVADRRQLGHVDDLESELVVQRFVEDRMTAVSGVMWDGVLIACLHQEYLRRWPVDCGTACWAVTIEPDEQREARLVELLARHRGVFQAQYIGDLLIDVNPRPYGSMPLALAAGLNYPDMVCRLSTGSTDVVGPTLRGDRGVRYRWLDGDVRHVLHRVRHRNMRASEAMRAIAPRRRVSHSVVSWRDPAPAAGRVAAAVRNRVRR